MIKAIIGGTLGLLSFSGAAMAACTSYPYTLANGATADATQVMANFNCAAKTGGSTLDGTSFTGTTAFLGPTTLSGTNTLSDATTVTGTSTVFTIASTSNGASDDIKYVAKNSTGTSNLWMIGPNITQDNAFQIATGSTPTVLLNVLSSGYVGIGTSTPTYPLQVTGTGGTSGAINITGSNSTLYSNYLAPNTGSTISVAAGGGTCTYSGGSGWSCSSDERLKENIADLPARSGLAALHNLRPVTYDMKKTRAPKSQLGFLAQNVKDVFPQAVTYDDNAITPDTPNGSLLVNYTALIPPVVLAVQELDARLTPAVVSLQELKSANENQAREIGELRAEVSALQKKASNYR